MRQANLQKVVQEMTDRPAVVFDQNIRYSKEKVWPFWYGFIPRLFLNESAFRGGLGPLGWKVLPGETKDIHIKTRRDTAYRLLGVKYTPYICIDDITDNPLTGDISITLGSLNATGAGGSLFLTEINIGQTLAIDDGSGGFVFLDVRTITTNTALTFDTVSTATSANADYSLASKIWYDRNLPHVKSDLSSLANVALTQTNAPGTISIASGLVAVTGVGTGFQTAPNDFAVGDIIEYSLDTGINFLNNIATITNDLTATVGLANPSITTSVNYKRIADAVLPGVATITVNATTGAVVGVASVFTAHAIGDTIYYVAGSIVRNALIISITDALNMNVLVTPQLIAGAAVSYALGIDTPVNPSLPLPAFNFLYRPTASLLTVTIILTSLQNRYQLGGTQYRPGSGLLERPENITALQGQNDGMGFIRAAALLPAEATIIIRITNNSATETIIVNGTLFGYKVSLNEVSKR